MTTPSIAILGVYKPDIPVRVYKQQLKVTGSDEQTKTHFKDLVLIEAVVEQIDGRFKMIELGQLYTRGDYKDHFQCVYGEGSPLLRFLWGEAGTHAVRGDPELKRFYRRKLVQKGLGKARVAVARKLGIRLWIMLRDQIDYEEFCRRGQKQSGEACAGMPETRMVNDRRPVD